MPLTTKSEMPVWKIACCMDIVTRPSRRLKTFKMTEIVNISKERSTYLLNLGERLSTKWMSRVTVRFWSKQTGFMCRFVTINENWAHHTPRKYNTNLNIGSPSPKNALIVPPAGQDIAILYRKTNSQTSKNKYWVSDLRWMWEKFNKASWFTLLQRSS